MEEDDSLSSSVAESSRVESVRQTIVNAVLQAGRTRRERSFQDLLRSFRPWRTSSLEISRYWDDWTTRRWKLNCRKPQTPLYPSNLSYSDLRDSSPTSPKIKLSSAFPIFTQTGRPVDQGNCENGADAAGDAPTAGDAEVQGHEQGSGSAPLTGPTVPGNADEEPSDSDHDTNKSNSPSNTESSEGSSSDSSSDSSDDPDPGCQLPKSRRLDLERQGIVVRDFAYPLSPRLQPQRARSLLAETILAAKATSTLWPQQPIPPDKKPISPAIKRHFIIYPRNDFATSRAEEEAKAQETSPSEHSRRQELENVKQSIGQAWKQGADWLQWRELEERARSLEPEEPCHAIQDDDCGQNPEIHETNEPELFTMDPICDSQHADETPRTLEDQADINTVSSCLSWEQSCAKEPWEQTQAAMKRHSQLSMAKKKLQRLHKEITEQLVARGKARAKEANRAAKAAVKRVGELSPTSRDALQRNPIGVAEMIDVDTALNRTRSRPRLGRSKSHDSAVRKAGPPSAVLLKNIKVIIRERSSDSLKKRVSSVPTLSTPAISDREDAHTKPSAEQHEEPVVVQKKPHVGRNRAVNPAHLVHHAHNQPPDVVDKVHRKGELKQARRELSRLKMTPIDPPKEQTGQDAVIRDTARRLANVAKPEHQSAKAELKPAKKEQFSLTMTPIRPRSDQTRLEAAIRDTERRLVKDADAQQQRTEDGWTSINTAIFKKAGRKDTPTKSESNETSPASPKFKKHVSFLLPPKSSDENDDPRTHEAPVNFPPQDGNPGQSQRKDSGKGKGKAREDASLHDGNVQSITGEWIRRSESRAEESQRLKEEAVDEDLQRALAQSWALMNAEATGLPVDDEAGTGPSGLVRSRTGNAGRGTGADAASSAEPEETEKKSPGGERDARKDSVKESRVAPKK